jgi:hypothetical protein
VAAGRSAHGPIGGVGVRTFATGRNGLTRAGPTDATVQGMDRRATSCASAATNAGERDGQDESDKGLGCDRVRRLEAAPEV